MITLPFCFQLLTRFVEASEKPIPLICLQSPLLKWKYNDFKCVRKPI